MTLAITFAIRFWHNLVWYFIKMSLNIIPLTIQYTNNLWYGPLKPENRLNRSFRCSSNKYYNLKLLIRGVSRRTPGRPDFHIISWRKTNFDPFLSATIKFPCSNNLWTQNSKHSYSSPKNTTQIAWDYILELLDFRNFKGGHAPISPILAGSGRVGPPSCVLAVAHQLGSSYAAYAPVNRLDIIEFSLKNYQIMAAWCLKISWKEAFLCSSILIKLVLYSP